MEPRTFAAAARSVVCNVVLGSALLALPIAARHRRCWIPN